MPSYYSETWFPVLVQILIALAVAGAMIGFSAILGQRVRDVVKSSAYESGMKPVGNARERFSVKFYLVAMVFILFDIEAIFLYPWAVVYRQMLADHATRNLILGSMISFMVVLFAGYLYALNKKAFDWKS